MTIGQQATDSEWVVVKSTDSINKFTCTDSNGDAFDISGYEFYFVARERAEISSKKVIEILNADIIQTDSGTGTTDTFTIDITKALSNIERRIYYYEIRSKKISGGNNDVWFNGILNIGWTVQEAR